MKYNYKSKKVGGVEYIYSAEWIYDLESEEHWRLYWNQQKLMQNKVRRGDNVLEIGVGSGFTANYLKSKGVKMKTLDIDREKEPDIVANLVEYQFPDCYDHILAFEVFEHIPFIQFKNIIGKMSNVCKNYMFLSFPRNEKLWLKLNFQLPILGKKELCLVTLKGKVTEPAHFWEIDDGSVSINDLEDVFCKCGLTILTKIKRFSRIFYALNVNRVEPN
jgi:2-polyprenyl-3-methyl-5-hydroxy-6-metoxy-1,4-benzoquinol methylase